jgi:FkbM family methyltransferase
MKNIFLDCGSNIGQGFQHFSQIYSNEFEYILFEPNPHCYKILVDRYGNREDVTLLNKAVYVKDDILEFYFNSPLSEGGSLISNHNSLYYDSEMIEKVKVESVGIAKLIDSLYNDEYNIIVKLDVESSEYDILEHLIETESILKVSKIYCEFHTQYMNEEDKNTYLVRENSILEFTEKNNIDFEIWI